MITDNESNALLSSDDGVPISQFGWITRPAAHSAVQKAYESALKAGLPDDLALALAEAVMDPAQLRKELGNPKRRYIDGCSVDYVVVDVWSSAAMPSLENVRYEHERGHWLSAPDKKLLPRFGSAPDAAALTLDTASPHEVVSVVSPLVAHALASNSKVKTIPQRGVEEPVMLAFARLSFADRDPVTLLEPVDGFCRIAQALDTLAVRLFDSLVTFNAEPQKRVTLNKAILEAGRAATELPTDTPTVAERKALARARLRCLVLQKAVVIIGFDGNGSTSFDQVRRRLVGRLHLSPPMEFTAEATHGAKAHAALDALHDHGRLPTAPGLSSEQVAYALLGDAATPVPEDGIPDLLPDEITALALRALRPRTDAGRRDVDVAIRDLTGQRPKAADCQQVAAELGLRAAPGVTPTAALRAALARAWQIGPFTDVAWKVTRRPVRELLDDALTEQALWRRSSTSGPAMCELAVLASWYLVTSEPYPLARSGYGTKRSVTRTGSKDNREPNTLLRTMMQSKTGLRHLAQVVYDGRAGRGLTMLTGDAEPVDRHRPQASQLTEQALRQTVVAPGDSSENPEDYDIPSPEDDWTNAQKAVRAASVELDRATKAMQKVRMGNGQLFARVLGYSDVEVTTAVDSSRKRLEGLAYVREGYLESLQDEEDEEDEEDEDKVGDDGGAQ